jgi:hypothetical protein
MIGVLNPRWHSLVTDFDQDHALVVGYGATTDMFQTIMMKPPNVVNIFPLECETCL